MKLWVMRHGYAGDFSTDPKIERTRPLKPIGVEMAKAVAQAMGDADETPKMIFCSPYARALQTADIVGKYFGIRVTPMDDLAPDRPLSDRILELIAHDITKRLLLVGHVDNTTPAMDRLADEKGAWDPLKMAEVRRVKIGRKSGDWKLKWGVKPSDVGPFPDKIK